MPIRNCWSQILEAGSSQAVWHSPVNSYSSMLRSVPSQHFIRSSEVEIFFKRVSKIKPHKILTRILLEFFFFFFFSWHRWCFDFMSMNESLGFTLLGMGKVWFLAVFPIRIWINMKLWLGKFDMRLWLLQAARQHEALMAVACSVLHCLSLCVFSSFTQWWVYEWLPQGLPWVLIFCWGEKSSWKRKILPSHGRVKWN